VKKFCLNKCLVGQYNTLVFQKSEWWWIMKWKGCGRKQHGLLSGTIPAF
jgi:hypothetical protein